MRQIPVGYLLEYAKAQIGNPYWYGTYGQILNPSVWRDNAKRYPRYYTDARKATAKARGDHGKKGHDCSGLIKGALWTYPQRPNMPPKYIASEDMDANTMIKTATESGSIATIPEIAGLAVWKNNHIGIYMGNGNVIEAKGFDYGVIESKLSDTKWTKWGKLVFIDYTGAEASKDEQATASKPTASEDATEYTVKKGDTLTKIAKMWNVTVDAIAKANNIQNVNLIQIGQIIRKPMASAKPAAATPPTWDGIVATQKLPLNIRGGAGMQYPIIGTAAKGSTIKIIGVNMGGWYRTANGGYVSAKYIKKA